MSATMNDQPIHEPFSWLDKSLSDDRTAQFVATTFDFCNGIALCLELAHSANLERTHNADADDSDKCQPAIGIVDTEHLLMFAQSAARLLAANAMRHIDRLNATSAAVQKGAK
jgi:hypothetical protein